MVADPGNRGGFVPGEDVETTLAARHKRQVTFIYHRCHPSAPALQGVAALVAY
jgi:hypothetical protein